jgi:hypothetical protein
LACGAEEGLGLSPERLTDGELLARIHAIHAQFEGVYGSPRMHEVLRQRRHRVGKAAWAPLVGRRKTQESSLLSPAFGRLFFAQRGV